MSRNPRRFWPKWGIGIKINWCVATRVYAYFSRPYCEQPMNQQGIKCSGVHFDYHNRASILGHHNVSISLTRASWRANRSNENLLVESLLLTDSAYIAIHTRTRVSFCWDYPILWPFLYTLKSWDDALSTFFRQFVFQRGVLRHPRSSIARVYRK